MVGSLKEEFPLTKLNKEFHMKQPRSIKCKEFHILNGGKRALFRAFLGNDSKTKIFRRSPWKLGMKANAILGIALIVIMLVSVFAWLSTVTPQSKPSGIQPVSNHPTATPTTGNQTSNQTRTPDLISNIASMIGGIGSGASTIVAPPRPPGLIESNPNADSAMWKAVAATAWQYFQPGIGVNSTTGLPSGSYGWPYFTDWDLGVYIQAVIDANKTGLIDNNGDWGSHARLDKVVTFLETRELTTTKAPYWFYGSDGKGYTAQSGVDVIDTGTLFVALNNLKNFDNSFASRINNFTYNGLQNNRTDYAVLVPSIQSMSGSPSIYAYYCVSGFAFFWPELATLPNKILNNMYAGNVTTPENVTLPKADISCEPLLYSVFNLNYSANVMTLMNQIYLAHEAKYNASGQYVAFSEGISPSSNFIWEWVVRSSGDTWNITNSQTYLDMNPVIYTKVSLSFLALYNTTYARSMNIYLERILPDPTNGYSAGADYNANSNNANIVPSVDSNTNGLILSAARYAIHA